ncbi:uncharacterized protein EMH_0074060 [Eimeria mitis]|uniref:Uncharacterized protein n=1 Tax=Eimeria mitis TaxID=44415 RepID=U6K7W7_9EIME|nr:uncharacterized protein EMH_0074060 [Eimeria mitis]CDJ32302.1 hypothetical protein, conserved [Eimeria mitis]
MSPSDAETFQQLRAQQRMCSEKKYKLQALFNPLHDYPCFSHTILKKESPIETGVKELVFYLALCCCGLTQFPPGDMWLVCCWLLLLLLGGLYGLLQLLPLCTSRHKRLREWQRHISVKGGSSSPQVLLLMSSLLAHLVLAAGLCLFTAAPQYASFGNQTFVPQNGSDAITCSLHAAAAGTSCRLTVFAAALSRVAFVGVLLCLIYVAACRRAVPSHAAAWDSQQQRMTAGAAARAAAGDLDDLAVVDESARLIGV